MISANFITEWAAEHPRRLNEQVEQDLLISRSLVAIYDHAVFERTIRFLIFSMPLLYQIA